MIRKLKKLITTKIFPLMIQILLKLRNQTKISKSILIAKIQNKLMNLNTISQMIKIILLLMMIFTIAATQIMLIMPLMIILKTLQMINILKLIKMIQLIILMKNQQLIAIFLVMEVNQDKEKIFLVKICLTQMLIMKLARPIRLILQHLLMQQNKIRQNLQI